MGSETNPPKRVYRSIDSKIVSGVAGGLGEIFEIDPTLVRLLWVVTFFVTGGFALLAYLVMWAIVPTKTDLPGNDRSTAGVGADQAAVDPAPSAPALPSNTKRSQSSVIVGAVLIALGALMLADLAIPFSLWSGFGDLVELTIDYWPVLLIAIGALILARQLRRNS